MYQSVSLSGKKAVQNASLPIFVADTKIIFGYNFVAPLNIS